MQLLVEDMSSLMRSVALHNAPLLHQHSCRRMDSGAVAVRDQVPPPGFYKSILVRCPPPLRCSRAAGDVHGVLGGVVPMLREPHTCRPTPYSPMTCQLT